MDPFMPKNESSCDFQVNVQAERLKQGFPVSDGFLSGSPSTYFPLWQTERTIEGTKDRQ